MTDPERWARIESLYHAVLAMPPDARAGLLARECGEDAALRAELESLLAQGTGEQMPGGGAAAAVAGAVTKQARIGEQIGLYVITAPLGAGGMGEVYRARDTKLGRDVALKVLPPALALDRDRLARFEREARVLAALNHPNIAQIHGLEEHATTRALVMELVEGETLADRLRRGPIPVTEALGIARQISDALAAAHEQGIIHRDLKPANIKVRPDGLVKLLDFGLAKVFDPVGGDALNSPTISARGTEQGVILGTAAYMSPEQARGKSVDRRTDLWAFGVVLMEMLTGRRVFEGDTASEALASVLKGDPPFDLLPADTPESVRVLLRRCLRKDARLRLDSATAARLDLDDALERGREAAKPSKAYLWLGIATTVTVVIVVAMLRIESRSPSPPLTPTRLTVTLQTPDPQTRFVSGLSISPDGQTIAAATILDEGAGIYVRRLNDWRARHVPGTDSQCGTSFFPPDGAWVAFFRRTQLLKAPVAGGPPQVVASDLPIPGQANGASWRPDGRIVFTSGPDGSLWQLSADGTGLRLLLRAGDEGQFESPEQIPNTDAIVLTVRRGNHVTIAVLRPGDEKPRIVVPSGDSPRILGEGYLLYAADKRLFAVRFDLRRLEVVGEPLLMVDDGPGTFRTGSVYALSSTGTLVYLPGNAADNRLVWRDRQGHVTPVTSESGRRYRWVSLSPNGRRMVATTSAPLAAVWLGPTSGGPLTRRDFGVDVLTALWMHDGQHLVVNAVDGIRSRAYVVSADSDTVREQLYETTQARRGVSAISPDDSTVLFDAVSPTTTTGFDIWEYSRRTHMERPLIQTPADEFNPSFSPDGHWIAYQSNDAAVNDVYVQPYPDGPRTRISAGGPGGIAHWNPNGREIFYESHSGLYAVPVLDTHPFRAGTPKLLFSVTIADSYQVASDGNRFLMIQDLATSTELHVVQGWLEELKSKLPGR